MNEPVSGDATTMSKTDSKDPASPTGPAVAPDAQVVIPFKETGRSTAGTFRRYRTPSCEFVVRLPPETGKVTGLEQSSRQVTVDGRSFQMVRRQTLLSPPPARPGQPPTGDTDTYKPIYDVLTIGTTELTFRRSGQGGCSDEELERILAALKVR